MVLKINDEADADTQIQINIFTIHFLHTIGTGTANIVVNKCNYRTVRDNTCTSTDTVLSGTLCMTAILQNSL